MNDTNILGVLSVHLSGDLTSKATTDAVRELRDDFITDAFRSVQATVYVGCASADDIDFNDIAAWYQPIVFSFVLGLSFILLLIVFRSIVIPFTAIIMNLLPVGWCHFSSSDSGWRWRSWWTPQSSAPCLCHRLCSCQGTVTGTCTAS